MDQGKVGQNSHAMQLMLDLNPTDLVVIAATTYHSLPFWASKISMEAQVFIKVLILELTASLYKLRDTRQIKWVLHLFNLLEVVVWAAFIPKTN